jgi:hypothetical protein
MKSGAKALHLTHHVAPYITITCKSPIVVAVGRKGPSWTGSGVANSHISVVAVQHGVHELIVGTSSSHASSYVIKPFVVCDRA